MINILFDSVPRYLYYHVSFFVRVQATENYSRSAGAKLKTKFFDLEVSGETLQLVTLLYHQIQKKAETFWQIAFIDTGAVLTV